MLDLIILNDTIARSVQVFELNIQNDYRERMSTFLRITVLQITVYTVAYA